MRKESLLFVCLLTLLISSCGGGHKAPADNHEVLQQIHMSVAKQDTIEVTKLAEDFINALKNKDIDNAMSMLYYLKNDTIGSLPASIVKEQRQVLKTFSGKEYRIEFLQFNRETDSKVKIFVALEGQRGSESNPGEIGFVLRPVRRSGKWYLTTDDTMTEQVPSEIEN